MEEVEPVSAETPAVTGPVEAAPVEEPAGAAGTPVHAPPLAPPGAKPDDEGTPLSDASVSDAAEAVTVGSAGPDIELLRRSYSDRLKELIERSIRYPVFARRARLEGTCMVSCSLMCSGKVLDIEITKSSGHELLDKAALKAVSDAGCFPPPPEDICTGELDVKVPVTFSLSGR